MRRLSWRKTTCSFPSKCTHSEYRGMWSCTMRTESTQDELFGLGKSRRYSIQVQHPLSSFFITLSVRLHVVQCALMLFNLSARDLPRNLVTQGLGQDATASKKLIRRWTSRRVADLRRRLVLDNFRDENQGGDEGHWSRNLGRVARLKSAVHSANRKEIQKLQRVERDSQDRLHLSFRLSLLPYDCDTWQCVDKDSDYYHHYAGLGWWLSYELLYPRLRLLSNSAMAFPPAFNLPSHDNETALREHTEHLTEQGFCSPTLYCKRCTHRSVLVLRSLFHQSLHVLDAWCRGNFYNAFPMSILDFCCGSWKQTCFPFRFRFLFLFPLNEDMHTYHIYWRLALWRKHGSSGQHRGQGVEVAIRDKRRKMARDYW